MHTGVKVTTGLNLSYISVNIFVYLTYRNTHATDVISLDTVSEPSDSHDPLSTTEIPFPIASLLVPTPQPPLIPSSQLPLPDLPIQPIPLHVPDNEGYQDVYQFINDDTDPIYKDLTQTSSTSSDVYAVSSHRDSEHSSSCKSSQSSPKSPEQVVIKDQYFTMPPPCQKTHEYGNADGTFVGPSSMA